MLLLITTHFFLLPSVCSPERLAVSFSKKTLLHGYIARLHPLPLIATPVVKSSVLVRRMYRMSHISHQGLAGGLPVVGVVSPFNNET